MGTTSSKHGEQHNNRHIYVKRSQVNGTKVPRAVPSAYIPPPEPESLSKEAPIYAEVRKGENNWSFKPEVQKENYTTPNGDGENVPEPTPSGENKTTPAEPHLHDLDTSKQDVKPEEDTKPNGYVKHTKPRKSSEHTVYKERAYKVYDPDHIVQREKSYRLYDEHSELRPRSYIHYENVKPGYVVRERGYKMQEPRYHARRVANTYGTMRSQPEMIGRRSVGEVHAIPRPVSEIRTVKRPVRVVRAVPPMPMRQVKAQTIGRPIIVRRSVEPNVYTTPMPTEKIYSAPVTERVYATTPMHGYIPRHRLGEYRPKVIDGYVAPTNVKADQPFSDPGGYRERVILEPVYQTRPIPPPPYPGVRMYEKEKIPVQKTEILVGEKSTKRHGGAYKLVDGGLNIKVPQTDDEKLKGFPKTQFIDDGKTIMIIDYLVDPMYTKTNKVPLSTSTLQRVIKKQNGEIPIVGGKQNGEIPIVEEKQNGFVLNENDIDIGLNDSFSSDLSKRQRPEKFGNVRYLP